MARKMAAAAPRFTRKPLRKLRNHSRSIISRPKPLTPADEEMLAAEFDSERGLDLPREERARRSHALAEGAPKIERRRLQDAW